MPKSVYAKLAGEAERFIYKLTAGKHYTRNQIDMVIEHMKVLNHLHEK